MKTAGDIISVSCQEVWTIPAKATVYEALRLMSEKDIGALPVRDKDKNVVGIISERDVARKVALSGNASENTLVEAIMTPASRMIIISPDTALESCMELMTEHHIRHLPVFAKERLIGIISSRDVIQAVIQEKNRISESLREIGQTVFTQRFDDNIAGGKG
ncbi:MAG TPA: CBS domain-containing protein [Acidobacteriota bacterium]|nr:CBS domain-containing protein [Acidobacteriota bacterium]